VNPYQLKSRDSGSKEVRVVIDTPGGSRNKYKFDEKTELFRVSRILPAGMSFPHDFGSIPGTCAEDGDPLDVLVLETPPTFPGCLLSVRLIGQLRAHQIERGKRIRNDRLIGVAVTPVNRPRLTRLSAVEAAHLRAIEEFFVSYNRAQGRVFRIDGRDGPREAQRALQRAEQAFGAQPRKKGQQ
jgi:inorganic pyrophosphatase